jgi:hypothetical protein
MGLDLAGSICPVEEKRLVLLLEAPYFHLVKIQMSLVAKILRKEIGKTRNNLKRSIYHKLKKEYHVREI